MSALIVEHLADRLERVLPGAVLRERRDTPPERRWVVERPSGPSTWDVIAAGPTQREAIYRAEARAVQR
jgi:hypothetical protein